MIQQTLIYDGWQEAVNVAIVNSGKSMKQVAVALWPHMKMDSAYARLKGALNPEKPEKLQFDEIIFICNYCGQFDPLYFMAQECGHSRPELRIPEDEQALLMQRFNESVTEVKKIAQRLEQLNQSTVRAVK